MPTLTPTRGVTSCAVKIGLFSRTYDNKATTGACFKTDQMCVSAWYWDSPVNVTKLRLFTETYYPKSSITKIYGLVGYIWDTLWEGDWRPSSAVWDSKVISCDNCTGIRIRQTHVRQTMMPCIYEIKVDYETPPPPPPEEGKAVITNIDVPTSFISGDWVVFKITVQNTGGSDDIFCRIVNTDTGQIIVSTSRHLSSGEVWTFTNLSNYITQATDFRGRVEAGHEE